jgi:hypothetical protein
MPAAMQASTGVQAMATATSAARPARDRLPSSVPVMSGEASSSTTTTMPARTRTPVAMATSGGTRVR